MSIQHRQTRRAAAKQASYLADWQGFRALQAAAYETRGRQVPRLGF